jgi:hypothetical protein
MIKLVGETMKRRKPKVLGGTRKPKPKDKPRYVPPKIVTFSQDEIIEIIGPAMACSVTPSCPVSFAP